MRVGLIAKILRITPRTELNSFPKTVKFRAGNPDAEKSYSPAVSA